MSAFVPFDTVWSTVLEVLNREDLSILGPSPVVVIRDLNGRARLALSKEGDSPERAEMVRRLASMFRERLGPHAYDPNRAVLHLDPEELGKLQESAMEREVKGRAVFLLDRLVTGSEWATVARDETQEARRARRITLFSLKGGVGRTTTAAVLATQLARQGRRVLLLDLDLESPGVSPALLKPEEHPDWGIVDWFTEDLVGQGDQVLTNMAAEPRWAQDFPGAMWIVPAYGQDPREYLAKLGRVYLDRPPVEGAEVPEPWTNRLQRLVRALEDRYEPDVVLLDSRSGLHDLAAAVVTDLEAEVLLFAVDSDATWTGYRILFRHWQEFRRIPAIREKLWMVAAMIPDRGRELYLTRFREATWELFREVLYDEVPAEPSDEATIDDWFSFDLQDEDAPHNPLPIYWTAGLSAPADLRDLDDAPIRQAYHAFLERFERLWIY